VNKQHKRTYLEMQMEEASLESGRYNTDYGLFNQEKSQSILESFRKTNLSLGESTAPLAHLATARISNERSN
jgi:hypothetical protein